MSCINALRFFFSVCLACTTLFAGLASTCRWTVFCHMLGSYILHTILGNSWRRSGVAWFRFRSNSRCLHLRYEACATASLLKLPSRACEHDCTTETPAGTLPMHCIMFAYF
uniref:Putative secreted protein n=1 Tax=Ixodes ricinus TaxID=34613 RepID=A0A6B0UJJ9_IXORI